MKGQEDGKGGRVGSAGEKKQAAAGYWGRNAASNGLQGGVHVEWLG